MKTSLLATTAVIGLLAAQLASAIEPKSTKDPAQLNPTNPGTTIAPPPTPRPVPTTSSGTAPDGPQANSDFNYGALGLLGSSPGTIPAGPQAAEYFGLSPSTLINSPGTPSAGPLGNGEFASSLDLNTGPQFATRNNSLLAFNPDEPVQMAPYYVRPNVPTPVSFSVPVVRLEYAGQSIELKFTVDRRGRPYNIAATSMMADPNLVAELASTVQFWTFDPARNLNGDPIERTVILPMTIAMR